MSVVLRRELRLSAGLSFRPMVSCGALLYLARSLPLEGAYYL
jgi:hypothetical protein